MENKKITMIAMATLAIVTFAFAYVFVYQKQLRDQKVARTNQTSQIRGDMISLPSTDCGIYSSDQDAHKNAIEKKDIAACICIKKDSLRNICQETMMDNGFADQALAQMDENICNEIRDEDGKNSCSTLVRQSVQYLKANDPNRLAQIYGASHNNDQSIEAYEKLVATDSKELSNILALALAYADKGLSEQGQGRDQSQYVAKAFEAIEKAKAIDNNKSEVYRVEAYINEIKPDLDQAMRLYNKSIEIDPKNILAYASKGHVDRMQGQLQLAVDDFTKAAELDTTKDNLSIYTNLCSLEFSRGNFDASIANCTIVTGKKNTDPASQSEAYQILAMIYMQNKEYVQAKNYLLSAKMLVPNDPNLYITLAKLSIFQANYTESEANARKSIELSPEKAASYLVLSQALYMQERYQYSIAAAEKGLGLVANDVSLLAPSKPAAGRDLNYSIANNYRQMGDTTRQKIYEQKAEAVLKNK